MVQNCLIVLQNSSYYYYLKKKFIHCNSQTTQATELTKTRLQIALSILITFHIKKTHETYDSSFKARTATVSYSTRHRNSEMIISSAHKNDSK